MLPNNNSQGIEKIVPRGLLMTISGTYHNQELRPWTFNGTMSTLNTLCSHIANVGTDKVRPELIAAVAPGMLGVGHAQAEAKIANGWGTRRGVFVLKFDVHYRVGTVISYVVQGYTDEPSFTPTAIADNLIFYVNNIFTTTRQTVKRAGVTYQPTVLVDSFKLVSGYSGKDSTILMRPRDVMSQISNAELGAYMEVKDTSTLSGVGLQTSSTRNNVGSTMLSEIINSFNHASGENHLSATTGDIASSAYASLVEKEAASDVFLNLINSKSQIMGGSQSSFRFSQLNAAMESSIMNVYHFVDQRATSNSGMTFSTSGDCDRINDQVHEGQVAVNLQAIIPAIMVESMLSTVSFYVDNHGINGVPNFKYLAHQTFDDNKDNDFTHMNNFQNRVMREVVPILGQFNSTFSIHVFCCFFHELQMTVTINGREVYSVSPCFTDGLTAPVHTPTTQHLKGFAEEMQAVLCNINDVLIENGVRVATAKNLAGAAPGSIQQGFRAPPAVAAIDQPVVPTSRSGGLLSGLVGGHAQPAGYSTGLNPTPSAGAPNPGGLLSALTGGLR